jgi:hypothetical protein
MSRTISVNHEFEYIDQTMFLQDDFLPTHDCVHLYYFSSFVFEDAINTLQLFESLDRRNSPNSDS